MTEYILTCACFSMRKKYVVIILIFNFFGTISTGTIFREPVPLVDTVICSRNMECGWDVCLWAQESNGAYGCQFFQNHCNCPPHLRCLSTHMSDPTESHLVWDYRCQEPNSKRK